MPGRPESTLVARGSVATACDDDTAQYELLRRAICERDDAAWAAVLQRYERLVRSWVRLQNATADPRDQAAYVNRAFFRFWHAIGPTRFADFKDLSALLGYLKLCAASVVLDDRRSAQRHPTVSLNSLMDDSDHAFQGPSAPDDPGAEVFSRMSERLLWALVERILPAPADRLLASLSFVDGLPPAAISRRHPDLFPTAQDVYRRKAQVLERLRRSPALQASTR
jgi:DNA-directed RNA polymerase specialized sigma24 family protein